MINFYFLKKSFFNFIGILIPIKAKRRFGKIGSFAGVGRQGGKVSWRPPKTSIFRRTKKQRRTFGVLLKRAKRAKGNLCSSLTFLFLKRIFWVILISNFLIIGFQVFSKTDILLICESIEKINEKCNNLSQKECQEFLEECQEYLEQKSVQIEKDIRKTYQEKRSLQNEIYLLKKQVKNLTYQISQGNLMVKSLTLQIGETQSSIDKLSSKIENSKKQLINILRAVYEEEQKSLIEILFEGSLSDFFDNLVYLENLNSEIGKILENTKNLKFYLEEQKQEMDEEKENLERTVKVQTLQKQQSETLKREQERILRMTEAQYQEYLKEKKELEKIVAEIMKRIAQLTLPGLDVPTTKKELYQLANWVEKLTNVRAALILGLIEVESALGSNIGQCNCSGYPGCRHPELSYKKVMAPRHWSSFETIVQELGLDVNTTPVSCYIDKGKVQMGGAMGPAQFMPNTWLNLGYKERVEKIIGEKANPWRARDAFLAAGLYLADWNAQSKNRQKEIGAITAYLCGTNKMTLACRRAGGKWYRNLVMEKADKWQNWINEGVL